MAFGSGKKGVIKRDRIADLLAAAKSIPDKAETKEDLTVGELIPRLWPAIGRFMGQGYNYRDIAIWMKNNGVDASEDTLVSAIGEHVRKRGKGRNKKADVPGDSVQTKDATVKKTADAVRKTPEQAATVTHVNGASPKTDQQAQKTLPTASRTSAAFQEDV